MTPPVAEALPADIETSSETYASRFSGVAGAWLLARQTEILLSLLSSIQAKTVLDVGGGHGQIAGPLCPKGYTVTVLGSTEACRARIDDLVAGGQCTFKAGNLLAIPFPDRSFDVVTCFRYISHCDEWELLVKELCRVAKQAVIIDYPPLFSFNLLTPLLFRLKKKIERTTRTYTIFRAKQIEEQFRIHKFSPHSSVGEFFFPMVLHRALKNPRQSALIERLPAAIGLRDLVGNPKIAMYTACS